MKTYLILALMLIWIPVGPAAGDTSDPKAPEKNFIKLKPTVVNNRDEDKSSIGLEFDADYTRSFQSARIGTLPTSTELQLKAEGLFVADEDLNPRSLRAEAFGKKTITFFRPELSEPGPNEDEVIITRKRWYGGRLDGGLSIGYETDQPGDHQNITAGIEAGYVFTEHRGLKGFIPSVIVGYDWVEVTRSELQETLTDDEKDSYRRLRLLGQWKFGIGALLPQALQPLELHIDARYYKDYGRAGEIERVDQDEARYISGALNYVFGKPILFHMITAVYLQVSDGRIPPAINDDRVWQLGIVLWGAKTGN